MESVLRNGQNRLAREIEAMGFDDLLCPDTQNLALDPDGQFSLAVK
jgi:hypothetical protein